MSKAVKLILAPLADFTDAAFRLMCFDGGADFAYTEMASAAALAHNHTKTLEILEKLPAEGALGAQIFGANAQDVAFAAREIEKIKDRFAEINLNAGCPMQKVTRSGAGAQLVKDPALVARLLKAIKENSSLPISLKTRLGPKPDIVKIYELLSAAEDAQAVNITIHSRFSSELHGGATHLDILAKVVEKAKMPVIGNGSVKDLASLKEMLSTGVDGVMIGRAALSNPNIFASLKVELAGEDSLAAAPSGEELFTKHIGYVIDLYGQLEKNLPQVRRANLDTFVSLKVRTHLLRYFASRPGAAALRARFNAVKTLADIWVILREFFSSSR